MPALTLSDLGDLVELTVRDYEKKKYVNLLTDLQAHPAANQLIRQSRMDSQDADKYEFKLRFGTAESFRMIDVSTSDMVSETDDFEPASVGFSKAEVKWSILLEEMDFNAGPGQIIDLAKAKEDGCEHDWVEGIENRFWAKPDGTSSPADWLTLPYWVTKASTTGFTGTTLSGYSDRAGINPTNFPRFKNYAIAYTNVALDDLISKLRTGCDSISFKPPVSGLPTIGDKVQHAHYTNNAVKHIFEDVADSRNDNLGVDVAKNDNNVLFRGAPIMWVPKLDEDTTNPWYTLNWDTMKTVVKKGWWKRKTFQKPVPGKRNQIACWYDTWMNFVCWNPRMNLVASTGTTYPS